jgi:hypothetical protein
VDGVLILYDVTNPASIEKLPESLGKNRMSFGVNALIISLFPSKTLAKFLPLETLADHGLG